MWYNLANMPEGKETNGVLIQNKIYLVGGNNNKATHTIDTYNLITGKWEREGTLLKGIINPTIDSKDTTIYLYEDGNFYTYNTLSKELNEYFTNIKVVNSKLLISNNTLYLIGGFEQDRFAITPSKKVYSINLNEFDKTRIFKTG